MPITEIHCKMMPCVSNVQYLVWFMSFAIEDDASYIYKLK